MISEETPMPLMHRDANGNDTTRRSTYWQKRAQDITGYRNGKGHVRRPDVVIVHDPDLPPYQYNIEKVVEMKFDDDITGGQRRAYIKIAGDEEKFELLREKEDCSCLDDEQKPPVGAPAHQEQQEGKRDTEDGVNWLAVGETVGMGAVNAFGRHCHSCFTTLPR